MENTNRKHTMKAQQQVQLCPCKCTVVVHVSVWRATRSEHDLCAWFDLHCLITVQIVGGTSAIQPPLVSLGETPITLDVEPGKAKAVAWVTCVQIM